MRTLIVEDDPDLSSQITSLLEGEGYVVDAARDGEEALELGLENPYAAVILDLGLPGMDGLSVLRRWREAGRSMPVIVLTATRQSVADMRDGVRAGATNYLLKPVDLELLLDWVRGAVNSSGPNVTTPVLEVGAIRMDTRALRVWVDGDPLKLTPTEFRLLHCLIVSAERPSSANDLAERAFDNASAKTGGEVPVYIGRLRDKLGKEMIETVRGYGYRLVQPVEK
ncbi:MAG: response regulator transcription factor [Pseudomonadota bacterium]